MLTKHKAISKSRSAGFVFSAAMIMLSAMCLPGNAFEAADYEEDAGLGFTLFYGPDGDHYGGGFESGVRWADTPLFGELFGYYLRNSPAKVNYYSVGTTVRLMPRWSWAPFAGAGGSYNRLGSEDSDHREAPESVDAIPVDSYWNGHLEAGLRIWFGSRQHIFLESGYRRHWPQSPREEYDWITLKYGRLF